MSIITLKNTETKRGIRPKFNKNCNETEIKMILKLK